MNKVIFSKENKELQEQLKLHLIALIQNDNTVIMKVDYSDLDASSDLSNVSIDYLPDSEVEVE